MSDYASATLVIYDIPEGHAGETFEVVREYESELEEIVAGDPIEMPDQRLDIVDELGARLEGFGVTFDLYQDAKYEYDGQGLMSLGTTVVFPNGTIVGPSDWAYTGGGSGTVMVTVNELEAILDDPDLNNAAAMLLAIRRLIGADFRAAMKAVLERNEEGRSWKIEQVSA